MIRSRRVAVVALCSLAAAAPAFSEPSPTPHPALAQSFDRADTDGDGQLSEKEAKAGGFFSRSTFGDVDRDSDGHVTLFELGKSVQGSLQDWLTKHDSADADHDGYVSKAEAGDTLSTVFDRADSDKDGRLGRTELMDDVTNGYYSETSLQPQPIVPNIIDEKF
jgi:hypothetical protein